MSTQDPNEVPPVPTPPEAPAYGPASTPAAAPASDAASAPDPQQQGPQQPESPQAPQAPQAPVQAYAPVQPGGGSVPPYGGTQQPYGGAPYAGQPAAPKGLSITSMVTGIVGVVLGFAGWGFIAAVAAIVFGHIAQRREPHAKPFWLTGLITGYAGLALSLVVGLVLVAAIFLPFLLIGSSGY